MSDTSKPLVSILIPLYNQERYFKACIRSVERQTYKNLEIIVVNDGSTDRSPQMAHDWAARDSRVKVIDKQNEGLAYARRDGYLAANGRYVNFLDSDDMLLPRAIESLLSCALDKDVDLVVGTYDKKLGFIKRHVAGENCSFPFNQVISQPELFEKYYVGFFRNDVFPVNVWARLYRKSVIDKAYQETELYSSEIRFMGEDQYFNVKLFPYLHNMVRIRDAVYLYRYGGGTFGFNRTFTQLFVSSDKRLKLLDHYNYEQGYEPLFAEYLACFYHHAAQMIHYKRASKDEVVTFFMHEVEQRELMPRLIEFYSQRDLAPGGFTFLKNRDFDSMYQFARDHAEAIYGSLKYKLFSNAVKLFERLS